MLCEFCGNSVEEKPQHPDYVVCSKCFADDELFIECDLCEQKQFHEDVRINYGELNVCEDCIDARR